MEGTKQKPILIVIVGPTGIGKTRLAIEIALKYQTVILSADSRQCYREMTIGTAKPTIAEQLQVKHYFINSHSITHEVSAYDYEQYGLKILADEFLQKRVVVLCGGTGLYVKALCEGLDPMPETDPEIKKEVVSDFEKKGLDWLRNCVEKEDPLFFEQGENKNPMRLLRALSFVRSSGQSILLYQNRQKKNRSFRVLKIGLELPRNQLYEQINQRVIKMMDSGLLKEAESLRPFRGLKNLNTVGYSELFDFFDGKFGLEEAVAKIQQHTRNYAKRQMTWFKKDASIHWFNPHETQLIDNLIQTKWKFGRE